MSENPLSELQKFFDASASCIRSFMLPITAARKLVERSVESGAMTAEARDERLADYDKLEKAGACLIRFEDGEFWGVHVDDAENVYDIFLKEDL